MKKFIVKFEEDFCPLNHEGYCHICHDPICSLWLRKCDYINMENRPDWCPLKEIEEDNNEQVSK